MANCAYFPPGGWSCLMVTLLMSHGLLLVPTAPSLVCLSHCMYKLPSSVVFDFIILVLSRLLEKQTLSQLNSDICPSHVFGFVQSCPSFEKGMKMVAILIGGGKGGG